jgi:hypothetical protein
MDEELLTSTVPRALEMKSKLFGFELPDLLLIFLNLSVTNLVFGASSVRYLCVWGTTLGLALFLFFAKLGKPDSYVQHLGEFLSSPSYRAAGRADLHYRRFTKG